MRRDGRWTSIYSTRHNPHNPTLPHPHSRNQISTTYTATGILDSTPKLELVGVVGPDVPL